ncbi:GIY-YIG nuclease family protein [Streptomyces antimycoticus]
MPISNDGVEDILDDDRLSPAGRQLLFAIFDHKADDVPDDDQWRELRGLLKELQNAGYLIRGDSWKSQTGGHLLLFDRSQAPTIPGRLPELPPRNYMRTVLYVVGQPGTSMVKIGITKNLRNRLKGLQTGSPVPLAVLWWHPGSLDLEEAVHREFDDCRASGEWFDFGVEEPEILVEGAVRRLRPDEFPPLPGL